MSNVDIYIVELTAGGHRITFLKYLTDYAKSLSISVCIVTLPETIAKKSFSDLGVPVIPLDSRTSEQQSITHTILTRLVGVKLASQISTYRRIRNFLKTIQPSKGVIFPTLQASGGLPLGLFGNGYRHPWSGVIMAPAAHLRHFNIASPHRAIEIKLQQWSYRRMVAHQQCLQLSSFDYLFVDWIDHDKVVTCPDPVELFSDYPSIGSDLQQIDTKTKTVIVVAGTIDKRKNIQRLASALVQMKDHTFHLLIAGSLKDAEELSSEPVQQLASQHNATIVTRRLSDMELDYCFHIADIVWSGNLRTYGSSGAVVRGSAHGKPVITMEGSVMGSVLNKVIGGPIIDMSSTDAIMTSLSDLQTVSVRQRFGNANKTVFGRNRWQDYAKIVFDPLVS